MTDNERIEQLNKNVDKIKNTIHSSCDVHLFVDDFLATVDLINRQKAEIKEKDEMLSAQAEKIRLLEMILDEKTAENEKNENIIRLADKTIQKQSAEIERLNIRNKALTAITKNYDWKFVKAKSEAIKEFAERLKEEATVDDDSTWWIANIDVDNLVKEMTEERSAT